MFIFEPALCSHRSPCSQHPSATHICRSSSATTSAPSSSSSKHRRSKQTASQVPDHQQQIAKQAQQEQPSAPQQQPIRVAINSSTDGIAKAVVYQLEHFQTAEVWATSAANHYTAVTALAEAHRQLQQRQQKGLGAVASLSIPDQPVMNDQKKGLKKLTLAVCETEFVDQLCWNSTSAATEHGGSRLSTTRTRAAADVMQMLLAELSAEPGAAAVVECRGEQAVTRALKAVLSLQASQGRDMLLQPWLGPVIDVVAEKRGEHGRLAEGLLLRVSWAQQQQQQQEAEEK